MISLVWAEGVTPISIKLNTKSSILEDSNIRHNVYYANYTGFRPVFRVKSGNPHRVMGCASLPT
jgi:hypothetical protein